MLYAVRPGLPERPTTAQVSVSSSRVRIVSGSSQSAMPPSCPTGPPGNGAVTRKYDPDMSSDFPMYALSEEHQAIREAVRAVCDAKVAPYAADVDENARYPREAADGAAGRGLPRAARARGVRRRRRRRAGDGDRDRGGRPRLRVQQPDPGGQQAGLAAGADRRFRGAEEEVPRQARRRRGWLLLLPVRAGRRLGRRRHEDQGGARRRRLGAQRRQAVDHQRRRVGVLHGPGRHRPGEARPRHLRVRGREVRRGRLLRCAGEEARHQGHPRPRRSTSTTCGSPPTG